MKRSVVTTSKLIIFQEPETYQGRKIFLCVFVSVSVGFEYESCLNVVLWERRHSTLQGFELDASNMGSWTLDKHHILDLQNGEMFLHFVLLTLCFVLLTALVFGSVWDVVSSEVAVELLRGQLHGLTMNIQVEMTCFPICI